MELTHEDLQKSTTSYKEDKGHIATYMKLCHGQKYEDFYLTPSGLIARMMGVWQKIIVLNSLWQPILKEYHNVRSLARGLVQDSETCGPAIPLARIMR